eukprot:1222092-Rhodomonas_salina.5
MLLATLPCRPGAPSTPSVVLQPRLHAASSSSTASSPRSALAAPPAVQPLSESPLCSPAPPASGPWPRVESQPSQPPVGRAWPLPSLPVSWPVRRQAAAGPARSGERWPATDLCAVAASTARTASPRAIEPTARTLALGAYASTRPSPTPPPPPPPR